MPPDLNRTPDLSTRVVSLVRQMDWFRGLRAAVALCAPIVLGDLAGIPNLGWAALGGFEAILADRVAPTAPAWPRLATLSLGGAAGLFLGSICGTSLDWAIPVTAIFCFLWSYSAVLGQPFASAGILVQVIFICGIGAPTRDWHEALNHALLLHRRRRLGRPALAASVAARRLSACALRCGCVLHGAGLVPEIDRRSFGAQFTTRCALASSRQASSISPSPGD